MPTNSKTTESAPLLGRTNRVIILVACVVIVVGFVLMTGEGSCETTFQKDIFSIRRTVVAPLVCLTGYLAIIVGILWQRRQTKNSPPPP